MTHPEPIRKRRLSGMSNAFAALTLDPKFAEWANPLYVVALTVFETNPGLDLMRKTVQDRLLVRGEMAVPRILSRFVDVDGNTEAHELDIDDIDINYHVRGIKQDRPWDDADVQKLANDMTVEGLDPMRPLWRYVLVEEMVDGRAVMLFLFNHCVGDGNSMSQLNMRRMIDTPLNTPSMKRSSSRRQSKTKKDSSNRSSKTNSKSRKSSNSNTKASSTTLAKSSAEKRTGGPTAPLSQKIFAYVKGVAHVLWTPFAGPDPDNKLKVANHLRTSKTKAIGFADDIPLARVLALKAKFHKATVNDIIMAMMTIMLRKYFQNVKDPVLKSGHDIRGAFPYDVRPRGVDVLKDSFGNHFANPNFKFPIQIKDPVAVLWACKTYADNIKLSPEPHLQALLLSGAVRVLSRERVYNTFLDVMGKTTLTVSNVRGPTEKVSIAGHSVDAMRFLGFMPIGLYFGAITYNGRISMGLSLDPTTESNPERLSQYWPEALEMLEKAADKALQKSGKSVLKN